MTIAPAKTTVARRRTRIASLYVYFKPQVAARVSIGAPLAETEWHESIKALGQCFALTDRRAVATAASLANPRRRC